MAGGLFLFPGIFTDIIAFILLLIPISGNEENLNKTKSGSFNQKKDTANKDTANKGDVIEGEYRREDDPK
jgi:UPF0716 protein FxsA